ncbi:MAG: hypothetical protein JO295_07600 [Verrucomicrobia bacterium]|nr:hypothetical protein [Verrucomicrobiota bacterium]
MPNVPEDIQTRLHHWRQLRAVWKSLHYGLGLVGIATSGTVAAKLSNADTDTPIASWTPWLAVIATACAALVTFLEPAKKMKAYDVAWSILSDAAGRYASGATITIEQLYNAMEKAQNTMLGSNPALQRTDSGGSVHP